MKKTNEYDELSFTDDFLFCKILENNEQLCKDLIELFIGKKVKEICYKNKQKVIEVTSDGKGIRLDVYLEDDEDTLYDIEMQTTPNKNIPKRTRYYQGMLDLDTIERGGDYSQLKTSYVIFICLSNPFKGKERHKYTFENCCIEDTNIKLGDVAYKVIVTPDSKSDDISSDLAAFLKYLVTKMPTSDLTNRINEEVKKAKAHEEWRTEYMTLLMRDKEKIEEGRIEGRIELIRSMIKEGFPKETILKIATEEEYAEAQKLLLATAD